jgi:hypothetical protein
MFVAYFNLMSHNFLGRTASSWRSCSGFPGCLQAEPEMVAFSAARQRKLVGPLGGRGSHLGNGVLEVFIEVYFPMNSLSTQHKIM